MSTETSVWRSAASLAGTENWRWVLITTPSETCSVLLFGSVLLSLNYGEQAGVKPAPGFINQGL